MLVNEPPPAYVTLSVRAIGVPHGCVGLTRKVNCTIQNCAPLVRFWRRADGTGAAPRGVAMDAPRK